MRKIMVKDECLLYDGMIFPDIQVFIDNFVWAELEERKYDWDNTNLLPALHKVKTASELVSYLEIYRFDFCPQVITLRNPNVVLEV